MHSNQEVMSSSDFRFNSAVLTSMIPLVLWCFCFVILNPLSTFLGLGAALLLAGMVVASLFAPVVEWAIWEGFEASNMDNIARSNLFGWLLAILTVVVMFASFALTVNGFSLPIVITFAVAILVPGYINLFCQYVSEYVAGEATPGTEAVNNAAGADNTAAPAPSAPPPPSMNPAYVPPPQPKEASTQTDDEMEPAPPPQPNNTQKLLQGLRPPQPNNTEKLLQGLRVRLKIPSK